MTDHPYWNLALRGVAFDLETHLIQPVTDHPYWNLALRGVAFDLETHLIQPGLVAPPVVCGSIATVTSGKLERRLLRDAGKINDAALGEVRTAFQWLLREPGLVIIGANIAFDMLCMAVDAARNGEDLMPEIFAAYAAGRVFDVQIAEKLHAVGRGHLGRDPRTRRPLTDPETKKQGRYSLAICTSLVLGRDNAKANDFWRMRYAMLEGIPVEDWPMEARVYPLDDACNTLEIALAQVGVVPNVGPHDWRGETCAQCGQRLAAGVGVDCVSTFPRMNLHDHAVQVFKHWCLHIAGAHGLRTDPVATEALHAAALVGRERGLPEFTGLGYLRPDGTEDQSAVKRACAIAYGATGACPTCSPHYERYGRPGKVPSEKNPKSRTGINCPACDGTGLDLSSAHVPMTDPTGRHPAGSVQIGRDKLVESADEQLIAYAAYQEDDKIIDTYCKWLRGGFTAPITLKADPIKETGRVSYEGTAQTLPRQLSARLQRALREQGVRVIGVRDCVRPSAGCVFYSNDYSGGELVTHAESCCELVGYSKLGEALNAGVDIHAALAATMLGISYEEFMRVYKDKTHPLHKKYKLFRQAAKPGNFGFPGRMGAARLVQQQREQGPDTEWPDGPHDLNGAGLRGFKGQRLCLAIGGASWCGTKKTSTWNRMGIPRACVACLECGEWTKKEWRKQWPENVEYLDEIVPRLEELGWVVQHYSKRIRGGVDGGSIANGFFQAYLADITARAQIRVATEQYVRTRVTVTEWPSKFEGQWSPLYGTRSIVFAHDELIGEAPAAIAAEASERVGEVMVEEFRKACPRHAAACKAEPTLMRAWYKSAEPMYDASGRLIPWEPTWE